MCVYFCLYVCVRVHVCVYVYMYMYVCVVWRGRCMMSIKTVSQVLACFVFLCSSNPFNSHIHCHFFYRAFTNPLLLLLNDPYAKGKVLIVISLSIHSYELYLMNNNSDLGSITLFIVFVFNCN